MHLKLIDNSTSMYEFELEESDWDKLKASDAKRIMTLLLASKYFEERILYLDKLNLVHGPAHSSLGQEGGAAGSIAALPRTTLINGTHRAHHQCLAKVLNALYSDDFDPVIEGRLPTAMYDEIRGMLHEILGLKDGWTGGRGGSMHLRREELGVMGTNAIVAGGLPIACGHAFAEKKRQGTDIVVSYFGDGAVHQGATHEAMNLAALYKLPILFFLENNQYAVSMSVEQSTFQTQLMTRPQAHGIVSVCVDGMNPFAVWLATAWCYDYIRKEGKPAFIQADVYRYYHQSSSLPGSAFGYRTIEEEKAWRDRDPGDYLKRELVSREIVSEKDLEVIDTAVQEAIQNAYESCIGGKGSSSKIFDNLWPEISTIDDNLTSDMSEIKNVLFAESKDFAPEEMIEMTYIEAISNAVHNRMSQDESVFVFGEDVANMGGGTVGATRGLVDKFSNRVINTPITENAFCGLATGAAMSGLRPIVELMYSDFSLVAADQLFNQASKIRHLFNGTATVPLVLRTRIPGHEGYGSQHSMDPAALFALFPGWHIVAPSNSYDYVGLMNSALTCNDPVLVLEPQELHRKKSLVPKNLDYFIPLNKAHCVRKGNDITLLTTLTMVEECQNVVERLGVSADIIDLRSLAPRDIDYKTIGESVQKTGRVAIIEQTTRPNSIGAYISDEIQRRFFDYLDQSVKRVTGKWAPPVVSKVLERESLATAQDIELSIKELFSDSGLSLRGN